MTQFHVLATDKPGSLELRMANRPAHLDWIEDHTDQVLIAGPFLDEETGSPKGSMLVVKADNLAALEAFLAQDPYAKAGLFQTVEIRPFKLVVGGP